MLLAIDVGNTNSKFAVHDGTKWRGTWRAASNSSRTADEYAVWLDAAMRFAGLSINDLNHCVISTVVPQALFHLRNLSRRYVGAEPWVVGENAELGIDVRIPKPSEAGADRLVK